MAASEWDPREDVVNQRKHGVGFAAAASVIDDPLALMAFDRVVEGETRWRLIGRTPRGETLVVAFVIRDRPSGEVVRIISARRALRSERLRYEGQSY